MQNTNLLPFLNKGVKEAGVDEAGRGCLAGPVFAAAVIVNSKTWIPGLDDSKKLSEKERDELKIIIVNKASAWAIASATPQEVDKLNILNATYLAMHRALEMLKVKPQHIIVDGNRFKPWKKVPFTCVVKGDGKYMSIAAASVLAKTARDEYMKKLHEEFPQYNWESNKGYATDDHAEALKKFGYTVHHRRSFHLKSLQMRLEF